MTIDQQIQWMLENQIRQQPGPYGFIILDEEVIYMRYREPGMKTQLFTAFTSRAKYVANRVVWHSSQNKR